jgi:preprotein translocase subunit SecF
MDIIRDTHIDWLKYRWVFIGVSFLVIGLGVLDIVRKGGVRYGIDFSEGTIVYAKFEKTPQIDLIREKLGAGGVGEAVIQRYDREELNLVMIRVERSTSEAGSLETTANRILEILRRDIEGNRLVDSSTEVVGPVVGQALRNQARNAVLISLAAMLVYIGFRFEPIYGVAATIAVFHDVLVTLGLVSIFNYEFSLNVIAAFLTLVGYQVNDTIVIFDRVRENRKLARKQSLRELLNLSLNQTLRRTILTSGLTYLSVLALFLFGGEVLRGFSFVLVVGFIAGTYSTIGIAAPVVWWWRQYRDKPASARKKTKPEAGADARV